MSILYLSPLQNSFENSNPPNESDNCVASFYHFGNWENESKHVESGARDLLLDKSFCFKIPFNICDFATTEASTCLCMTHRHHPLLGNGRDSQHNNFPFENNLLFRFHELSRTEQIDMNLCTTLFVQINPDR